ncbi:TPA: RsmB/NOP family class I SAM-dependent RNA methyltransferase [Candidatus Woesearchaeota archaeon]|nr:RsmB/NOP family class I SAM-dependent RNA methyltransferase [Candidatus Woesearchaeota archaeon]
MDELLRRYEALGHKIDPEKIKTRQSIRINTLKISESDCISRLKRRKITLKKIPFLDHGYWTDASFKLSSTQEYLQGFYYLQEAASQLPVQVLDPRPGDLVLDMAASPGSKTTQLAQLMQNKGCIIALESNRGRIPKLNNNLERLGVKDVLVYHKDARYASDLGLSFDKILLDAPCSGNFTQEPGWLEKRSVQDFQDMAKLQKALLKTAVSLLKPKGTLVYSTCSLEPEENEEVVESVLDSLPVKLQKTDLEVGEPGLSPKTALCCRFWPEKSSTQPFFLAKLVRK